MNARAMILASAIALLGLSAFSFAPALAQSGDDPPLRLADARTRCLTFCFREAEKCFNKATSIGERQACQPGRHACQARCATRG